MPDPSRADADIRQPRPDRPIGHRRHLHAFVAGLEVLSGLGTQTLTELFGDGWPLMWGMRNRIAHGYLLVDAGIVRQTVNNDIPPILTAIRTALS